MVLGVQYLNEVEYWAALASHHSESLIPRCALRWPIGRQEYERHPAVTMLGLALVEHACLAERFPKRVGPAEPSAV